jgi:predicted Zn-dependent protease
MMYRNSLASCLLLLSLALGACAGTGGVSVEDEQQVGSEVARQVQEQVGLYNAEFLKNYVDAVGRRLVSTLGDTPYSFRFDIVDQAEPNAFATPGGYVYLSRGLLALINTEDELAGILAHEISHVVLRHHARQASRSRLPGLLTIPGRVVGAVVSEDVGNVINAPLEAAGQVYLSSFSRAQEAEADREALGMVARAGYDPQGLGSALDTLGRAVQALTGESGRFSFFDTHPATPERAADARARAAGIDWRPAPPFAKDRAAVMKRLDGLWWGRNNPAQGVFRGQVFVHPDMDFTVTFPEGWRTLNTPRFLGAVEPAQESVVILGNPPVPGSPRALARLLEEELRSELGVEPIESRAVQIGEWPGYLVRIADLSGVEPTSIYYLWVESPRTTFQIIGAGPTRYRDVLRDTVMSLRALSAEERESVTGYRLRIVEVLPAETVDEFSARTANAWPPDLTRAANGLPADARLDAGQLLKIIREERY